MPIPFEVYEDDEKLRIYVDRSVRWNRIATAIVLASATILIVLFVALAVHNSGGAR